ncbi:MAG: hypothetical protein QM500_21460 [Methylococcales bacterium]
MEKEESKILMSYTGLLPANQSGQFKEAEVEPSRIDTITSSNNYSNLIFKNGIRKADNFLSASTVILDFDGTHKLEEMKKVFSKTKNVCIVTSKSHQKSFKANFDGSLSDKAIVPADYFHVIIKLPTPITDLKTYRKVMANLIDKYGSDPSCKDAARFYYGHPKQEYWYS